MSIPATLESRVLKQMEGTIASLGVPVSGDAWATIVQTLVSIFLVGGTIACLVFFLFSVEHKGSVGKLAYFGRLCIMAGFGASFGYTVMARVSLLIGRIQFLTQDCWKAIGQLFS